MTTRSTESRPSRKRVAKPRSGLRASKALERELAVREKSLYNAGEFSAAVGISERTLVKAIRAARLTPLHVNGSLKYHLTDLISAHFLRDAQGEVDPTKLDGFRQKALAEAALARLKLSQLAGQLIWVSEHQVEVGRILQTVLRTCLVLPDIAERVGASPAVAAAIEAEVDRLREQLADELAGKADEEQKK